jgi:uncharacterized protein
MKFILFIILAYLLYRLLKRYFFGPPKPPIYSRKWSQKSEEEEEMIKDPQCGIYCPKKQMIPLMIEGTLLHFCSEQCKNSYLQRHGQEETRSEK